MIGTSVITFDGKALFGQGVQQLDVKSWHRGQIDRSFAGLDGIFSVDLGRRGRELCQRGQLAQASMAKLRQTIDQITRYIDGQSYTLMDSYGECYSNVRMDSFRLTESIAVGSQVSCCYEIHYTQLSD